MLALALPILLAAHARAAVNETADYKEVLSQQQTFGDDVDAFDDAQDPFLYAGDSDAYDALAQSGAQYYGDEFETYYADNDAYAAGFGGDLPSDAQEMCIEGKDGKANLTGAAERSLQSHHLEQTRPASMFEYMYRSRVRRNHRGSRQGRRPAGWWRGRYLQGVRLP